MPDHAMPDDNQDVTEKLTADMKAAMKAGDRDRLGVIRMLLAEARSADLQGPSTTPLSMVQGYHKRLKKSRDEYDKLGEADTVKTLDAELAVVEEYVPKQAGAGETQAKVDAFLDAHPDFGPRDIGKATGLFMKEHGAGGVDAKAANGRIREVLADRP